MTRRRVLLLGSVAVVAALVVAAWALRLLNEEKTLREKAAHVEHGMTLAEVEHLFGRPTDEEQAEPAFAGGHDMGYTLRRWRSSNKAFLVVVDFNEVDRVHGEPRFHRVEDVDMIEWIRRRLGL
jgi:hypothetical protein